MDISVDELAHYMVLAYGKVVKHPTVLEMNVYIENFENEQLRNMLESNAFDVNTFEFDGGNWGGYLHPVHLAFIARNYVAVELLSEHCGTAGWWKSPYYEEDMMHTIEFGSAKIFTGTKILIEVLKHEREAYSTFMKCFAHQISIEYMDKVYDDIRVIDLLKPDDECGWWQLLLDIDCMKLNFDTYQKQRKMQLAAILKMIPPLLAWRKRANQSVFHPDNLNFDISI